MDQTNDSGGPVFVTSAIVLWEMLRLKHEDDGVLCRNAFGIDAAVWTDPFRQAGNLNYGKTDAGNPRVVQQAEIESLTWRGWYVGSENAIQGTYHHTYNQYDDALWNKMRVNEWLVRPDGEDAVELWLGFWHLADILRMLSIDSNLDTVAFDHDERANSEKWCLDLRTDWITDHEPDISWDLNDHGNLDKTDPRTSAPDVYADVNQLAREVPALLRMHPSGDGTFYNPQNPNGATGTYDLKFLEPSYFVNLLNRSETDRNDYLFTHLDLPHGCVQSPVPGAVSHDMANFAWKEYAHSDYRAQSIQRMQAFYRNLAVGTALLKGEDLH